MELVTRGKEFWTDEHPIYYNSREDLLKANGSKERFRLVFIRHGTGIMNFDHYQSPFVGPVLFCLNHLEQPLVKQSSNITAESVYFHPALINFAFNLENIVAVPDSFSLTERHDAALLTAFTYRGNQFNGQLLLGPSSSNNFDFLFRSIGRELNEQPNKFWVCRSRSYLLELLIHINRLLFSSPFPETVSLKNSHEDLEPVIDYLHNHFSEKITIDELTQVFHTNHTTLTRKFTQATGMSVIAYLIRLRVQLASVLLRDTGLPVAEIMERVGFKDISHFIKSFQKITGYTPSQYRQRFSIMD